MTPNEKHQTKGTETENSRSIDETTIIEFIIYLLKKMINNEQVQDLEKSLSSAIHLVLIDQFRIDDYKETIRSLLDQIPQDSYSESINTCLFLLSNQIDLKRDTRDYEPSGKFGYDLTNPIMTTNVRQSYQYLNQLVCSNGDPIQYKRLYSCNSGVKELARPLDVYAITNVNTGEALGNLYVYAYSHYASTLVPEGYKMRD